MTKDEQDIVTSTASRIARLHGRIEAVDSAHRHSGDSISGYISLTKRAAEVMKDVMTEAEAAVWLAKVRADAVDELTRMEFPAAKPAEQKSET